jgi:hypothetical protein
MGSTELLEIGPLMKRVLIVEDNFDNMDIYATVLAHLGSRCCRRRPALRDSRWR